MSVSVRVWVWVCASDVIRANYRDRPDISERLQSEWTAGWKRALCHIKQVSPLNLDPDTHRWREKISNGQNPWRVANLLEFLTVSISGKRKTADQTRSRWPSYEASTNAQGFGSRWREARQRRKKKKKDNNNKNPQWFLCCGCPEYRGFGYCHDGPSRCGKMRLVDGFWRIDGQRHYNT